MFKDKKGLNTRRYEERRHVNSPQKRAGVAALSAEKAGLP